MCCLLRGVLLSSVLAERVSLRILGLPPVLVHCGAPSRLALVSWANRAETLVRRRARARQRRPFSYAAMPMPDARSSAKGGCNIQPQPHEVLARRGLPRQAFPDAAVDADNRGAI